ncbi:type 2 lanthipeptide synthetase LanM [Chryseobacterium sp. JM1]|uniref:type 2 lanthipeptide synthetase LanM n=1 Tax=Chryseobacterium sp. JM1 TaxID=1233950 RepID=UPI0004E63BE2|nr:type 2 lanthipeptide synthetase LanM [Chryseobacterium sp. JM1]KFF22701.1 hypothetical protein IW22_00130 [Chryseobacterium sp. JM1]
MFDTLFLDKQRESLFDEEFDKTLFLNIFTDWISFAKKEIKLVPGIFEQEAVQISLNELQDTLISLSERVLFIEYNVFLEENEASSIDEYAQMLLNSEYRKYLYDEYPHLFKLAHETIVLFIHNINEIVSHFLLDQDQLVSVLNIRISPIHFIRLGLGDKHNGNKTVALIRLSDCNLIYKPRKLQIEGYLSNFIEFYNKECGTHIYIPKMVLGKDYGWVEFIENTENQFSSKPYKDIGHVLAILYMINGTDFHYENIIFSHGRVALIDCETIFTPTRNKTHDIHSVLSIGLLPNRVDLGGEEINMGGINLVRNMDIQTSSITRQDISIVDGSITSVDTNITFGKDIKTANDEADYNLKNYLDDILSGFEHSYKFFMEKKPQIIDFLGSLPEDIPVRYLVRHTMVYSHILYESLNPELLTNEEERKVFLEQLNLSFEHHPHHRITFSSEINALMNNDIPYFYCGFKSDGVEDNSSLLKKGYFDQSPMEASLAKINNSSAADLNKQLLLIKYSFAQNTTRDYSNVFTDRYVQDNMQSYYSFFQSLVGNDSSYFSLKKSFDKSHEYLLELSGPDFFNGGFGDLLCLAEANKIYGNTDITRLIDVLYEKNSETMYTGNYPLGMSGIGGMLYSLIRLYSINKEEKYAGQIRKYIQYLDLNHLIISSANNGVTNGRAGLLIALLEIYKKGIETQLVKPLIQSLYHHLNTSKVICDEGIYWKSEFQRSPLCGMAHGSSGIILSLLRYYLIFENSEACRDLIKNAVLYENTYYNSHHNNWKDNRDFVADEENAFLTFGWSHGSPGIGLTRLSLIQSGIFEGDSFHDVVYKDLINCVKSTLNFGLTGMDNVIFGNYGNAELLFRFARHVKNNEILYGIENNLNSIDQLYLIENNKGLLSPGLFNGVSGCAYQLLYFNQNIKNSILTFECNE